MAFVPYSLTCANREDPEKCGWFSGHACGFKGCDPQPECYVNKIQVSRIYEGLTVDKYARANGICKETVIGCRVCKTENQKCLMEEEVLAALEGGTGNDSLIP
jgi:hypothetical protein